MKIRANCSNCRFRYDGWCTCREKCRNYNRFEADMLPPVIEIPLKIRVVFDDFTPFPGVEPEYDPDREMDTDDIIEDIMRELELIRKAMRRENRRRRAR